MYDTEKLSERIAKLAGGVAVIKVRAVWVHVFRRHDVQVLLGKARQHHLLPRVCHSLARCTSGRRHCAALQLSWRTTRCSCPSSCFK